MARFIDVYDEASAEGKLDLWTKADSVTYFDELTSEAGGKKHVIPF
jgi:hypothetical protein